MAKRGGYRDPGPGRKPPAGPGKFSQRTDGQTVATPGLSGPDIQYGDVGMLARAQRAVRIPGTAPAGPSRPQGAPQPNPAATQLPDYLFGHSNRPNEPGTAGSPFGPGPGPETLQSQPSADIRELVLQFMVNNYQNVDAANMLTRMRNERALSQGQASLQPGAGAVTPPTAGAPAGAAPPAPAGASDMYPIPSELNAPNIEDLVQPSTGPSVPPAAEPRQPAHGRNAPAPPEQQPPAAPPPPSDSSRPPGA